MAPYLLADSATNAAWLTAWAQVAGVVVALGAVAAAVAAFVTQGRQLDELRSQAKDQREANAKQAKIVALQTNELLAAQAERECAALERRRTQAAQVFIQLDRLGVQTARPTITQGAHIDAIVHNTSPQPVYDVLLRWYMGTAPWSERDQPAEELIGVLSPNTTNKATRHRSEVPPNIEVLGAVVVFRDTSGVWSRRREDGELTEIEKPVG